MKPPGAKIITVSGAKSNVGKTALIQELLTFFKGWSCIKVTLTHQGRCPTERDCGACDTLASEFSILDKAGIIEEEGKDTYRLKQAGAKNVLWLKARPEGLEEGIKKALGKLRHAPGVVIEGTSVLKYLKPDLAILVKRKGSLLKPSAREVLERIDLVVTL